MRLKVLIGLSAAFMLFGAVVAQDEAAADGGEGEGGEGGEEKGEECEEAWEYVEFLKNNVK